MTGMAFGWTGATTELASVVRKPKSSCSPSTGALFGPRTPRQGVHRPAKAKSGLSTLSANHMGVLRGFVSAYSQNEVAGTRHRLRLPTVNFISLPVRFRLARMLSLIRVCSEPSAFALDVRFHSTISSSAGRHQFGANGYDLDPTARARSEDCQANVRVELSAARGIGEPRRLPRRGLFLAGYVYRARDRQWPAGRRRRAALPERANRRRPPGPDDPARPRPGGPSRRFFPAYAKAS